jgi:hypothetical protein
MQPRYRIPRSEWWTAIAHILYIRTSAASELLRGCEVGSFGHLWLLWRRHQSGPAPGTRGFGCCSGNLTEPLLPSQTVCSPQNLHNHGMSSQRPSFQQRYCAFVHACQGVKDGERPFHLYRFDPSALHLVSMSCLLPYLALGPSMDPHR